jgi:hypothetical protein
MTPRLVEGDGAGRRRNGGDLVDRHGDVLRDHQVSGIATGAAVDADPTGEYQGDRFGARGQPQLGQRPGQRYMPGRPHRPGGATRTRRTPPGHDR